MRIIAGEFRGRRLKSPPDYSVRPTSDKVKEAVFSIILPYFTDKTVVMDVFAGSGNLGLEALSRGAVKAYFSDVSRDSLKLVKDNVAICKAQDRSVLLNADFRSAIARVKEKVDFYFLDPPYAEGYLLDALDTILDNGSLSPNGMIVCEHDIHDKLPEEYRDLECFRSRRYGKTGLTIYRRKAQ